MSVKSTVIVAGPCAIESKKQITDMAYKISMIRDIATDYQISFKFRAGAWKPRTLYRNESEEKIFEGTRENGLTWLSEVAETYSLPVVSEVMSEMDLRHFIRYLDPDRDYLQIGARTSQAFALLYAVGGTRFNVLLKSPPHGVEVTETIGSLQRFENNKEKVYCTRGQKHIINPSGFSHKSYNEYVKELYLDPHQHPDSRNLNNIEAINELKRHPYFRENRILFGHDPSHIWGGKTDIMRRRVGEYAIKAIREFGYDWIMVEVDDRSAEAICDADQALLTTTNGVDWSKTNAGREPEVKPLTLVDIVCDLIELKADQLRIDEGKVREDTRRLGMIRWDASA